MSGIAERLREFRAAVGLTQREVAQLCGLGKRTIIYWEMGEREIKCSKLVPLVDEYDLDFNWLILGRGQMFNVSNPIDANVNLEEEADQEPDTSFEAEVRYEPEIMYEPEPPAPHLDDEEVSLPLKPEQEDVLTLIERLRRK